MQLEPLPVEKGSDFNIHVLEKPAVCEHFFFRTAGTEVKCRKCPIGFYVSPDVELKEGHLYKHGSKMI